MRVNLPDDSVIHVGFATSEHGKLTVCVVAKDENYKELAYTGIANKSFKDFVDPDKGRRVALERAIKPMSRELRKFVWDKYLMVHPPDRS